ncbi:enoyl-CoA hydratase [Algirhabdus cladophorae]|uniref:enoyl-CoA hydratase n=1 Tax=Algirhabdus cladophorae TaxID=3377108 RepID=UPI003B849367
MAHSLFAPSFAANSGEDKMLDRTDRSGVAHLTMNNPQTLNALSDQMIADVSQNLTEIAADKTIRAVIISGAGKAFCAGHNLREIADKRQSPDGGSVALKALFDRCANMMQQIRTLPQPVIAQVHGIATAAGAQLVATCDMAVAAEGTRFGVNGVNIGLFCSTPMVALSRNIPRKKAFEMLTTGQFIPASEAVDVGLINKVVPEADLAEHTRALAELVASKLGSAVKIGKEAFYNQIEMQVDDAYAYTGDVMVQNMSNADTVEGINAFIEKRDPNWPSQDK